MLSRRCAGKAGEGSHRAATEWLNITSLNDLGEIMYFNGRMMPVHQPMYVPPESRALIRPIWRPIERLGQSYAATPAPTHPPDPTG
jgi:hypothetical protein